MANASGETPSLVRKSWMGILELRGSEAGEWLQGMVTNDVQKLRTGEGCYAGHLTAQGKLVAQADILSIDGGFLLLVEAVAAAKLTSTFDRLIVMEDAQVSDVSSSFDIVGLFGAGCDAALAS